MLITIRQVVNTLPTEPSWAGKRVNYGKDRCAYIPKSQQAAAQQAQVAAAQSEYDVLPDALPRQQSGILEHRRAGGGDDDIPYRGRERREKGADKQRGMGGADLDGEEPDAEKGRKRAREEEGEGEEDGEEDGDGYYSLVKRKAKEKKELKKAEYEAAQAAARYIRYFSIPPRAAY